MSALRNPKVWHRADAISGLRSCLLMMTGGEKSACQLAAERRIFCQGFRRWNEAEFDRRWRRHIGRSTHLSRAQMEEYANVWELAEQVRRGVALACDAQAASGEPCRGWNEFSNADLARFCSDMLGENVEVVE